VVVLPVVETERQAEILSLVLGLQTAVTKELKGTLLPERDKAGRNLPSLLEPETEIVGPEPLVTADTITFLRLTSHSAVAELPYLAEDQAPSLETLLGDLEVRILAPVAQAAAALGQPVLHSEAGALRAHIVNSLSTLHL
jgi:hypothetical protein